MTKGFDAFGYHDVNQAEEGRASRSDSKWIVSTIGNTWQMIGRVVLMNLKSRIKGEYGRPDEYAERMPVGGKQGAGGDG